ncbi:Mobile element protein [Candidatus Enterovibrio altilux]|uniref:Mobile element protein n=1 Tax=Candidatus Enterovibrio altilux TaxID=1927128 RepID=A0A291B7B3_9GAMM|nr:Mobile element protein [Candidatus Enterovibrio luxaltus]
MKKQDTNEKQRVGCKLHLVVDINACEIIAAELSASNVTDDEILPNLLQQNNLKINKIPTDGAHDTVRIKRAVSLMPQRKGITF